MNAGPQAGAEARFGWVVVAVAFVMIGLGFGALASIAVFMKPLAAEFGWSRGEVSFAYTMGALGAAFGGIFWGHLSDRLPTRPIAVFGAVTMGAPILLLSRQTELWHLYAIYGVIGGLGFGALGAPLMANARRWFKRNMGLALGVVTAGGAVGQGLVPFGARFLISEFGWQDAYVILGAAYLVVGIGLTLLVRTPPGFFEARDAGRAADGTYLVNPRIAVGWISVASIFCCICMAVPIVHVVALVSDRGFRPEMGAGVLATIMVAGAFGRILTGRIADRIGGLRTYMLMSFAQTALVFWFTQIDTVSGFYLLAVAFGLGYAGVMTCLIICAGEFAPARINGISVAVISMLAWVGMGLGGYQGGLFFDLTGDYTVSYANAVLAGVINLTILGALYLLMAQRRALAVQTQQAA